MLRKVGLLVAVAAGLAWCWRRLREMWDLTNVVRF